MYWTIKNGNFTVYCTIRYLSLPVTIYNQYGKEQAFCIPFPTATCFHHFQNSSIVLDLSKNLTTFSTELLDPTAINGNWTCTHGVNILKSEVEVFIPEAAICPIQIGLASVSTLLVTFLLGCSFVYIVVCINVKAVVASSFVVNSLFCKLRLIETVQMKLRNNSGSVSCNTAGVKLLFTIILLIILGSVVTSVYDVKPKYGTCSTSPAYIAVVLYSGLTGLMCGFIWIDESNFPVTDNNHDNDENETMVLTP